MTAWAASASRFMYQLNAAEKTEVVANCDHLAKLKFSKVLPYAFTEHGAIQAASVLVTPPVAANSKAASRSRAAGRAATPQLSPAHARTTR